MNIDVVLQLALRANVNGQHGDVWRTCWALRKLWFDFWAISKGVNVNKHTLARSIYVHLYTYTSILNHLECSTFKDFLSKSFKLGETKPYKIPNQTSQLPRRSNRQAFPLHASAASCAMRLEPNALVFRERCSGAAQSTKAAQCMMISLKLHNLWGMLHGKF